MANILKIEENERIDKTDFDFLSKSAILSDQEFIANFLVDPLRSISGADQRAFILEGFLPAQASSTQVSISTGKAVLAYRDVGIVKYGAFTVGGDTAKTLTVTGSSSTYYIWLRFDYLDGELGSRIFWNPTGDGTEFANTINTRQIPSWSIRIEEYTLGSPGAEWVKIGEVVWTGSAITSVTDKRHLFFEGVSGSSYQSNWSSDGGGLATDRNANRGTYGVKSLQTFTAAIRQCLEDIKGRGLRKWYARDIGGMNIGFDAAPVANRLAIGVSDFYLGYSAGGHVAKLEFMPHCSIGMNRDYPILILTANDAAGLIVADTFSAFNGDLIIGGTTLSFLSFFDTNPWIEFATNDSLTYLSATNVFQFKIGGVAIASLSNATTTTKFTLPAGNILSILDNTSEIANFNYNSGMPRMSLGSDFYIMTDNSTKNVIQQFSTGNNITYSESGHSLTIGLDNTYSLHATPLGVGVPLLGITNAGGAPWGSTAVTFTGYAPLSAAGGVGTIKMASGGTANSAGWLKIWVGNTAYWIPLFSAIVGS